MHLRSLPVSVEKPAWFDEGLAVELRDSGSRFVSVDVETTGLAVHHGSVTEIGWFDLNSGVGGEFIPPHDITHASQEALSVSRYAGRIAGRGTRVELIRPFHKLLGGDGTPTVIVGSNPSFDMDHLGNMFASYGLSAPWSRRPVCVAEGAFWLGVGGLDHVPGLAASCAAFDIPNGNHHAALDDAVNAAHLFTRLWGLRKQL